MGSASAMREKVGMEAQREKGEEEKGAAGLELTRIMILEEAREEPEKVETLELHNRQIKDIGVLETCTRLRKLDISFNMVTSIESMRYLKSLKVLRLYNNRLESLDGVRHLSNLQVLSVDSNNLRNLDGIEDLKFLHELSAAFNDLTELSRPGSIPTSLVKLDISSNGLEKLEGLSGLIRLERLSVNNNRLTDLKGLPRSPCQLKEFHASGNLIKSIKGIEKYAEHLDIVRLEDNLISTLSNLTRTFGQVTEVILSGNKIECLDGIERFPEVEILDLGKNRLCDIDGLRALASMEELRDLKVEGNPFAMGDAGRCRKEVLAILPDLDCLDDEEIPHESRPPSRPPSAQGAEGKIVPRAPTGARPANHSRRSSLGASKKFSAPSRAANGDPSTSASGRPMSARAGAGNRLLTAVQYENESMAFEEQVYDYQRQMTKLLGEMKRNLELPMDEITSMVKASDGEAMTSSLPEPPVIGAIKQQHKDARYAIPADTELVSLRDEEAAARQGEEGGRRSAGEWDNGSRFEPTMASAGVERIEEEETRFPADTGEEEVSSSPEDKGLGHYEYLQRDDSSGYGENGSRDLTSSSSEKAAKANYKGFRVPSRPLSARKSSAANLAGQVTKTAKGGSPGSPKAKAKTAAAKVTVPRVSRLKASKFKVKA